MLRTMLALSPARIFQRPEPDLGDRSLFSFDPVALKALAYIDYMSLCYPFYHPITSFSRGGR